MGQSSRGNRKPGRDCVNPMTDPRVIAQRIVGPVAWQSEVSGYCACPGAALHTSRTSPKDCRVNVDGAPTIYCFHASCVPAVAEANRVLRRELGAASWEIALPGGRVLRSGDVLLADGSVKTREVIEGGAPEVGERRTEVGGRRTEVGEQNERLVLETIRVLAERFRPELLERFRWPLADLWEESPLRMAEEEPREQFRAWLRLWPAHGTVWIGDVFSSGKPEHRTHFRQVADWYQIGPVMGNFTCGSSFQPGSYQRSNATANGQRFLVVESDTLTKDEVGAVFAYLRRRLRYGLKCIIDTGGKSLHAWFEPPRNKVLENRLKAGLTAFGCDPKMFTYSQPVRVPGAWREGRLQTLLWVEGKG